MLELLAAIAFAALHSYACIIASLSGGYALRETYGYDLETQSVMFSLVTRSAMAAYIWAPVVLGLLLLSFIFVLLRSQRSPLVYWAFALIASGITASVAIGITRPYARTTFRMGNAETEQGGGGNSAALRASP